MKSCLRILVLGALLLAPVSGAYAQTVSVSEISDVTLNAGATMTLNVVAVDPNGGSITLTSSLPGFVLLNPPTTGTGLVLTTLTLTPAAGDVGTFAGSVTATAGGQSDTENFQITVAAAGTNQAPTVTAPAYETVAQGATLSFTVTATDADADAITSLTAIGAPSGATFIPNASNTSGTFTWTPSSGQSGEFDVVFKAANSMEGFATTHIHVPIGITIANINNVSVAEGGTATIPIDVVGPTDGTMTVTASLPAFATLNQPTTSTGTGTLHTTITVAPGAGTAGTYPASVTVTNGTATATKDFTITVTAPSSGLTATAKMLGTIRPHKKFVCFRISPVNGSFDMRNVDVTSIRLVFNGNSISPIASKTHIDSECDEDNDNDEAVGDRDHDDDDDDCEDCNEESGDCVASLHACFASTDLVTLFGDSNFRGVISQATLTGDLSTGGTFVASIEGTSKVNNGRGNQKGLHARATPNPLNPKTDLRFTLSQAGRVRVTIYDAQGRLVKRLLDETRGIGDQVVTWDGSNGQNARVASGAYFFKIQAPQGEEIARVTVLK